MLPIAALIGINFVTGDVMKQFFSTSDLKIKDPIVACEQTKIRCEQELQEFNWTIIANHEALDLHRELIQNRPKKKVPVTILPATKIPSLKKKSS